MRQAGVRWQPIFNPRGRVVDTLLASDDWSHEFRRGARAAGRRAAAREIRIVPDVTVICGPSERAPESATHVTNPKVVVEITSPGTAEYDRGEKLQQYQSITSLEAIVIVDHGVERIELWTRNRESWQVRVCGTGETVPLGAVSAHLEVDEIYAAARNA